ncbi:MAG: NAD(P)-dependent alcohol dehydrogenase [Legionellaceae bacterium]|nr:NAD(P)-dependent alcohol dehydrogenase [Legionellaceae bacterium]
MKAKAYAGKDTSGIMEPFDLERRAVTANDVAIDILYCGMCHSDLHMLHNDWNITVYPIVPGHEIIGRVKDVGHAVQTFRKGDLVGVGCMVDACRQCPHCQADEQQFCDAGMIMTYGSIDPKYGTMTYGGYSTAIVVDKDFVLKVPESLAIEKVAPLLCAGITTYSPLKKAQTGPGKKIGIVGLGGLGHIAVKIARAMGADVFVFTHSAHKVQDAMDLGAHGVILSTDPQQMSRHANSFDYILDTVSAKHDISRYFELLKSHAELTQVGLPDEPVEVSLMPLVFKKLTFSGSLIGGIKETQEMLDFCAKHDITADVELIQLPQVNEAMERLQKGDVKYRFVIDMTNA